ncbi:MAG: tetratricopeptide repeat protein, partial [Nitrospinota bacterium]
LKPVVLENKIISILESRANPPAHIKLINLGEMLLKQKNYEEALEQFEQAKEMRPKSARIHVLLGEAYAKLKKFKSAEKSFEQATETNPRYLKGHTARANFHLKHGNKGAALDSLEQARIISPDNAERQTKIGEIYLEDGKMEKAKSAFSAALEHDPQKSREVGELYLKTGKAKEAETFFRKALKQCNDTMSRQEKEETIHIFNRLGIALRKQGRWSDAISEYENSLKINPNDEVLYYNMGKAYLEGGDVDQAANCFRKALLIDPGFTEATEELEKLPSGKKRKT